ncbi:MAG: class I SAM-dependent methyltransferase, partial [Anaerolineae bacterium]|nr:class I SAM-dependent methyltransferase [Anaerolineae bacterium]
RLRELLAPFPAQEGLLLDLGGGTGRVVQALGCRSERVVVADISEGMLRQAYAKGFPCVRAAAEALPFQTSAVGRVVVVDAFHHLADQEVALREIWRVLRHGGRLVVEEPDNQHWAVWGIALAERLLLMRSHFRPAEWLAERLAALGGTVTVVGERVNYWVVAQK